MIEADAALDDLESPRRIHPATLLIPLVVVGTAIFVFAHRDEVKTLLGGLRAWTEAQGWWGLVAFAIVYAIGVLLFVPGNMMTPVAAALFGPLTAIAVVAVGGTTGATLAFLVARYCVRDHVARRLAHNRRFQWLEEQTATRGSLFVAVARILPIMPGNVLHYAFGLTRVPLGTFVFWSVLGSMPGLVLFVTGLDAVFRLTTAQSVPWTMVAALAAIILVKALLLTWAARQAGIPLRWPPWRRKGPTAAG